MPPLLDPPAPTAVRNTIPSVHQMDIGVNDPHDRGVAGGSIGALEFTANPADAVIITIENQLALDGAGVTKIFEIDVDGGGITAGRVAVAQGATKEETLINLATAINAENYGVLATPRAIADPATLPVFLDLRLTTPGSGGDSGTLTAGTGITATGWANGHDELIGIVELLNPIQMGDLVGIVVNESETASMDFTIQESDTNVETGFGADLTYRNKGAGVTSMGSTLIQPHGRMVFVLEKSAARKKFLRFLTNPNDGTPQGRLALSFWTGRVMQRSYVR